MNRKPVSSPVVNIALLGAAGRMGSMLMETAGVIAGIRISAALVSPNSPLIGQNAGGLVYTTGLEKALMHSDVLLDFSGPAATSAALDACLAAGKPIVVGVTGLGEALAKKIATAGRSIPVLAAPNMSLGAVLLTQLVHTAATVLGENFAIEINDRHHRRKKDAPSGTALALGEAVASGRGVSLKDHAVFEGSGSKHPPAPGSIRFTSIREGEIVGDHTVVFTSSGECLELSHHAQSRAAFAHGALIAAGWIASKPAGVYEMADVLGLHVPRT
jgi:4-hydroxy-tetrahydrodipicolinate reductase